MDRTKIPHPDNLIPTLQIILKSNGHNKIAEKLEGSSCSYSPNLFTLPKYNLKKYTSTLKRGYNLNLDVPSENLTFLENDRTKKIILESANKILKPECRYEFVEINISPKLVPVTDQKEFDLDIKFDNNPFKGDEKHTIPEDIITNSKEMSQVYQLVYIIENALRHYIDEKCLSSFGEDYLENMKISKLISERIQDRSNNDKKNIWMGSKRDSNLYLLDLSDLYNFIENNWKLFEGDFPSRDWIKTQINEINECRKLIAHNNISIENHSKDVLITSSKSILKQLKYLE